MDPVSALVSSELDQLGDLTSLLVIGDLSAGATRDTRLVRQDRRVAEILQSSPSDHNQYDLVVYVGEETLSDLSRRALGRAVSYLARHLVIAVGHAGEELPVHMVEVKRGILMEARLNSYRVYGALGGAR